MNTLTRNLTILFLTVILIPACASAPPSMTLASHETLHLQPPTLDKVDLQIEGQAEAAAKGMALGAAGVAGGAAVGAAGGFIMGLTCGPMAIVCSPLAAAAGAVGVGFMGGVAGVGYGGKGWTSSDKGPQFNTHTESGFDQPTLEAKLIEEITHAAESRWMLDPASANKLAVRVTSLRFEQMPSQRIRLAAHAELTATIHGVEQIIRIDNTGPERRIDDWLQNDGRLIEQEIDAALSELTRQVFDNVTVEVKGKTTVAIR